MVIWNVDPRFVSAQAKATVVLDASDFTLLQLAAWCKHFGTTTCEILDERGTPLAAIAYVNGKHTPVRYT